MTDDRFGDALREILAARDAQDPKQSVPVYDLHYEDGNHSSWCLVSAEFLDDLWEAVHGDKMMPHDHLGDET